MVKIIVLNEQDVTPRPDLLGQWLDETSYKYLIEEDTDVYLPPSCGSSLEFDSSCSRECSKCDQGLNEQNVIFKFRKNFFTQEEVDAAYKGLREAAIKTDNRGIAAGATTGTCGGREWVTDVQLSLLEFFAYENTANVFGEYTPRESVERLIEYHKNNKHELFRSLVWLTSKVVETGFDFDKFIDHICTLSIDEARVAAIDVLENMIRNTTYCNLVYSGVAGWYSRYTRIPYGRATTYTRDNPEKFALAYPFFKSLSKGFQELLPTRFAYQMNFVDKIDQQFRIPETPFTTVTVNRNFRTAGHVDPANLPDGMANLCVLSNNDKYKGCYLVFPEIGYAVNVRPRDLLLVQNQCGLHGNTPLIVEDEGAERVSLIAYAHESMGELGSYEYESTRKEFIDSRRLNPNHPLQRLRWNGISPGLFCDKPSEDPLPAKEWYEYLKTKGSIGDEWLDKHHPWLKSYYEAKGIEDFF